MFSRSNDGGGGVAAGGLRGGGGVRGGEAAPTGGTDDPVAAVDCGPRNGFSRDAACAGATGGDGGRVSSGRGFSRTGDAVGAGFVGAAGGAAGATGGDGGRVSSGHGFSRTGVAAGAGFAGGAVGATGGADGTAGGAGATGGTAGSVTGGVAGATTRVDTGGATGDETGAEGIGRPSEWAETDPSRASRPSCATCAVSRSMVACCRSIVRDSVSTRRRVRRADTQDTIGSTIGIAATSSPITRMSNRPSGEPQLVWGAVTS